jgi:hypothetical protein
MQEIVAALECGCNIIPLMDNFHWPAPEKLPEDMRQITFFNGIRWVYRSLKHPANELRL